MGGAYGAKERLDRTKGSRDRSDVLRVGILSDILRGRIGKYAAIAIDSSGDLGWVVSKRVAKSQQMRLILKDVVTDDVGSGIRKESGTEDRSYTGKIFSWVRYLLTKKAVGDDREREVNRGKYCSSQSHDGRGTVLRGCVIRMIVSVRKII